MTPPAWAVGMSVHARGSSLIQSEIGLFAVLLAVLATVFYAQGHPRIGRVFGVIPALVFCYFLPTALTALHVIPAEAGLYDWVVEYVLPSCLLLLTLSLDVKAILRLGPKAVAMFLVGTAGVVLGGPIALLIWQHQVPDDAWRDLGYLAGSWIGGSANGVALQESFGVDDIGAMVVVDVACANVWMAALLILVPRRAKVDRWLRADASAITDLERRMADFQARVARTATVGDLIILLALGFGAAYLSELASHEVVRHEPFAFLDRAKYLGQFGWKVLVATGLGMALSFTPARNLEGVGASKLGGVMIYLLVACIGARASFDKLQEAHGFLLIGATWMSFHVALMFAAARLIRAPFFFLAIGSQANIGGAASTPVVASAFNPVLAPVGALLAIAGYVVGSVGGLACVWLCRLASGGQ